MPHLIYLAIGHPPAAKSAAPRMRAVSNGFAAKGWDVTAVSLADWAWEREMGLDRSLLAGLSPRVERVGVDIARYDLATDIRSYSRDQALQWEDWLEQQKRLDRQVFPEDLFGRWLEPLTQAVLAVHRRKPGDLLMASPGPYVTLGVALAAAEATGVPIALDYRDGWSIDVVGGEPAFAADSAEGRMEAAAVARAAQVWFVNDAIREFYAGRYPASADRFRTVRNGYDGDPGALVADHAGPLRFGYLGTLSLGREQFGTLLRAWRWARLATPLLADATFELRGHLGTRTMSANRAERLLHKFERFGARYGGPVERGDLAGVYAEWDALVLALIGGHYVTSGKVYEYVATGLPIVSAHDPDSAAAEVLSGYPRWFRNASMSQEDLALAFVAAAQAARPTTAGLAEARAHAAQFERARIIEHAVGDLVAALPRTADATRSADARPDAAALGAGGGVARPDLKKRPTPKRVSVVIVFGRHSNTPASWRTARHLIGDDVAVAAFFPDGVPARRPRPVRAYPIAPTPAGRRPLARLRRWRTQRWVRETSDATGEPDSIWKAAAADGRLHEAVLRADVLVASDRTAVPAVWYLAKLNRGGGRGPGMGRGAGADQGPPRWRRLSCGRVLSGGWVAAGGALQRGGVVVAGVTCDPEQPEVTVPRGCCEMGRKIVSTTR